MSDKTEEELFDIKEKDNSEENSNEEKGEKYNQNIVELLATLNTKLVEGLNVDEIYSGFVFNGKRINKTGRDFYEFRKSDNMSKYEIYFGTYKNLENSITICDPDRIKKQPVIQYNCKINSNVFVERSHIEIKENGIMTEGSRLPPPKVIDKMKELGFNPNSTILKIDDINNVNAKEVVEDLIKWVDIRYEAKKYFEKEKQLAINKTDFGNIKEKFAQWLLEVAKYKSYETQYYGNSVASVIEKLDEINMFFDRDLFEKQDVKKLKEYIENQIYSKGGLQNKEFLEYSARRGVGIPRGIIGRENYFKFLDSLDNLPKSENNSNNSMKHPLNTILYGPPGTGKTYNTVNEAIKRANPEFDITILEDRDRRQDVKAEYDRLVNAGQIVFTTFHQSMSYEDFIEGIKPKIEEDADGNKQVVYEVAGGIFKQLVEHIQKDDVGEDKMVYTFDDAWDELIQLANEKLAIGEEYKLTILTPNMGMLVTDINSNGNLLLKPSKGGEKEYLVSYKRAKDLQEVFPNLSVIKNIDKEFRAVIGGMNSTAYWSVLNFINNKIDSKGAKSDINITRNDKPHVLIIDEINRGNVSSIFGELITLIEDSKREGEKEALEVTLPYSKESFSVPSNLYIIGTMNTADRSVEALDTALRRRFEFEEMLPKPEMLKGIVGGIELKEILETINARIEVLLDRDHLIGHAYFCNVQDEEALAKAFKNKIIPLLQEYFYGNYQNIELVLGSGFITSKKASTTFARSSEEDLNEKLIYSFPTLKKEEIIPAVRTLLNLKTEFEKENDQQDS